MCRYVYVVGSKALVCTGGMSGGSLIADHMYVSRMLLTCNLLQKVFGSSPVSAVKVNDIFLPGISRNALSLQNTSTSVYVYAL